MVLAATLMSLLLATNLAEAATVVDPNPCINPVTLGATPNDDVSDRVAFQAAIDLAASHGVGTLCIPEGRFVFERPPLSSYNRFAALSTHGSNIAFKGAEPFALPISAFPPPLLEVLPRPRSVLALRGDQGGTSTLLMSLDPSATNISFEWIEFDGSAATNTDEQTHLLATSGICSTALGTCNPISGVTVRRCSFLHPRSLWRRGDSIRLLGNAAATYVEDVTIEDNDFLDAGRSAVELQRNLKRVRITGNRINCVSCDQAIDGEATGVVAGLEDEDITIVDNVVLNGSGAQGDYDIALTSAIRAEIARNTLVRGIALVRSRFVKIHDQKMLATMVGAGGVIEVTNVCEGLVIDTVTIVRSGIAGPLIRVVPTTNGHCTDFKVLTSRLIQRTASFGVFSQATNGEVKDNLFVWSDVPTKGPAAIFGAGTAAPVTSFIATGNLVVGNLQAVVSVQGSLTGLVHANEAVGTSVMCLGAGC